VSRGRSGGRPRLACGHLPPPPTRRARAFLRLAARVALAVQVGPMRVRGAEHLRVAGPKLVVANHTHYVDGAPFALLLDEAPRFMVAAGVFRFACGLLGRIAGACGAFRVDLDPGKGGPAREAAVHVLVSGQTLVLFPEGWIHMDGALGPLKTGAARILREAARRRGCPLPVVPVHLRYGRHPGAWIRRLPCPLQFLVVLLAWPWFRRGVAVRVGVPISSDALPANAARATAMLRAALVALGGDEPRPGAVERGGRLPSVGAPATRRCAPATPCSRARPPAGLFRDRGGSGGVFWL
jgi:1-acyl-sn-glycerol-3-phosphate acyltransferase